MKINRFLLLIFSIVFFSCKSTAQEAGLTKKDKENLVQALTVFNNAFQEGNTAVLASMITENYTHTNGNSKPIGKKSWLSYLQKRSQKIKTGELQIIQYKMEDLAIEYLNTTAIVTGKVLVSSKVSDTIKSNEYRITNLWVHTPDGWKRAGFHDGKIK